MPCLKKKLELRERLRQHRAALAAVAGRQAAKGNANELIPEFEKVYTVKGSPDLISAVSAWRQHGRKPQRLGPTPVPHHAVLLEVRSMGSEAGTSSAATGPQQRAQQGRNQKPVAEDLEIIASGRFVLKIGVPWSVPDFAAHALQLDRPFLEAKGMEKEVAEKLDAVFNILTKGPTAIRRSRKELIDRLRRRKEELSE